MFKPALSKVIASKLVIRVELSGRDPTFLADNAFGDQKLAERQRTAFMRNNNTLIAERLI